MRLETLRVPAPCHEDWDRMQGDERSRHCASCDKRVTNLSELTRPEAEAELDRLAEQPSACVRVLRSPTGEITTRSSQQAEFLALLQALMAQKPPQESP